jgi:predicted lipoprotein with Yx(FWY)xxD motif
MRRTIFVASAIIAAAVGSYAIAQTTPANVHAMNGMLMDSKGMTLYTWDNDKEANKSACTGNCLANWPRVTASAEDKDIGADWKVITNADGSKQWSYKGKPLYYFVMDKAAGDKLGDGRGLVWHIAKP